MMSIRSIAFAAFVLATVSAKDMVLNKYKLTGDKCSDPEKLVTAAPGKCVTGVKFEKSPKAETVETEFFASSDCKDDAVQTVTINRVDETTHEKCAKAAETLYYGVAKPPTGTADPSTGVILKDTAIGVTGSAFSSAVAAGMVVAAVSTQF